MISLKIARLYPQVQYVDVPGYAGFNEAPLT